MTTTMKSNLIIFTCLLGTLSACYAQDNLPKPELTEIWEPVPKIVAPADKPGDPPADAIVLFNGKNLDEWTSPKDPSGAAKWTLADGVITVKKGTGPIRTKRNFTDFQFHLEFRIPANITGRHGETVVSFSLRLVTVIPVTNYKYLMGIIIRPTLTDKWAVFINNLFHWQMRRVNQENGKCTMWYGPLHGLTTMDL